MWPKVSASLTKKRFLFLQENVHASKSFWKIYPLKPILTLPETKQASSEPGSAVHVSVNK